MPGPPCSRDVITYPSECSSDSSGPPRLPPWSNMSDLQPPQIRAPNPCHPGRKGERKKDFKYCPSPSSIHAVKTTDEPLKPDWPLKIVLLYSNEASTIVARGILQPVSTVLVARDQLLPSGQSNKDKANESPVRNIYSVLFFILQKSPSPAPPQVPRDWPHEACWVSATGNVRLQHRPSSRGFKATRVFQKAVLKVSGYKGLANGI